MNGQSIFRELEVEPLQRPGPLRNQVKDSLNELIISRQLPPGAHLVETDLAERLGVSRQPIREALQMLESDGWVDLRPGKGAFVHQPSDDEVDEVFEVRITLEAKSAALTASRVTAEQLAELRAICAEGREAVAANDVATVVERNATLHRRIAQLCGNRVLITFLASLDRRVRWYFTPIAQTRGISSWDEHDRLLAAFAAHDPDTARSVMREHTGRSREAYRAQLKIATT